MRRSGASGVSVSTQSRFVERTEICAREVLPGLKKHLRDLEKREEGQQPSDNQKIIKKTIAEIEASNDEPKIITLKDFITRASKNK